MQRLGGGQGGVPCVKSRGCKEQDVQVTPDTSDPLLCLADPTQDIELQLDGQQVVVPQGRPIPCPEFSSSRFYQSEYLIYQESQCCLRYLLEIHL
jgi:hypothetical protein